MFVTALLICTFATMCMTGLIWFVQLVHYPLFVHVGCDVFKDYERIHKRQTTIVVAPLMILELLTAVSMVLFSPDETFFFLSLFGLFLTSLIWASTTFVQVPLHSRLSDAYAPALVSRLVASNWVRTWLWSSRTILQITLVCLLI